MIMKFVSKYYLQLFIYYVMCKHNLKLFNLKQLIYKWNIFEIISFNIHPCGLNVLGCHMLRSTNGDLLKWYRNIVENGIFPNN